MIETLPERPIAADVVLPADVASAFAEFRRELAGRSQIVWGEHCSECAYPACYAHCAFYTPRSDFNCRRFEAGFEPLLADAALRRVRFRKWGKLEGRGSARVAPIAVTARRDRQDLWTGRLIDAAPALPGLKQNLAWRSNERKYASEPRQALAADGFVVEAWACDGRFHPFTLTILNRDNHGGRMFQARFEIDGAYRRLTAPMADILAQVDLDSPFLVQIEPVGDAEGVQVVFGVCDFVALNQSAATSTADPGLGAAKPAKVVVWDLDETLWTGVLAEDGAEGVRVRPEALAAIRMLDERGVLQSVASKNDESEALAALTAFGLADYFLHPQIHWNPKSGSIAAVAGALNLGLDSIVFIDDQPFERGEVEAAHPMVRTLPHTAVGALETHPWFDLPVTAESRQRRLLYREEAHRAEAFQTAGSDYVAFLRSSQITLSIDTLTPMDVERVFELSQRTNQLNFTGRKYARDEVQALLQSRDDAVGLCLRCCDRFGDYGLIGFAVVDCANGLVSELFMSCRVQRKRVEHAFFATLGASMAECGASDVRVTYRRTGRNGAAVEMLNELGFEPPSETGGAWTRAAAALIPDSDIVKAALAVPQAA
jgi:FkbH-like protein